MQCATTTFDLERTDLYAGMPHLSNPAPAANAQLKHELCPNCYSNGYPSYNCVRHTIGARNAGLIYQFRRMYCDHKERFGTNQDLFMEDSKYELAVKLNQEFESTHPWIFTVSDFRSSRLGEPPTQL